MRALLLTLFVTCSLFAADVDRVFPLAEKPNWSVYDGDTVKVSLSLGFDLTKRISLRINGVDTPELRTRSKAAGEVAKAYTQYWIAKHKDTIQVRIVKYKGKYGRPIGDFVSGSETLSAYLLAQGVAVKYGEKFTGKQLKEIEGKTVPKVEE